MSGDNQTRKAAAVFQFGERIYSGNIDSQVPLLEELFASALPHTIYLDCSRVQVCDSYALRILITLRRKADELGKKIFIYRPAATFFKILEATKLNQLFAIAESIEEPGASSS